MKLPSAVFPAIRFPAWPLDTIARRIAFTIAMSIVLALTLRGLIVVFGGFWGEPAHQETGLLERASEIVRMIDAVPPLQRPQLVKAAANGTFAVQWYSAASPVASMLDEAPALPSSDSKRSLDFSGARKYVHFGAQEPAPSFEGLPYSRGEHPDAEFLSIELSDASWVMFAIPARMWGLAKPMRIGIGLLLLAGSTILVSAVAAYHLDDRVAKFTRAMSRFGTDMRALPFRESGPVELRATIGAFNAMQAQVEKFVDDRTAMLAAISHDLRTPLTRMRLRGEFIEDEGQRARLFRDVEEMQAMVEASLSFFRDDYKAEESTVFDIPQLLLTIIDDYGDQGVEIGYEGPTHVAFRGRPFALKRAFQNLIDNAVRYGERCDVELRCEAGGAMVLVRDNGPGIPIESMEQVFAPFHRLERSRNRATGGVGLGLTSARAVIAGHGGQINLANRAAGGLEAEVCLPNPA